MSDRIYVIVTARDEAELIGATLSALSRTLPGASVLVADDGSRDGTAAIARACGARVVPWSIARIIAHASLRAPARSPSAPPPQARLRYARRKSNS